MSTPVIILRPEPGAAATAARVRATGLEPVVAPLFAAEPLAWDAPAADNFDALLLTSANAVRHGGEGLAGFLGLPCWCVGEKTAAAARKARFSVGRIGESDAASMMALPQAAGQHWLWLAGARHQPLRAPEGGSLAVVPVYAMTDLPVSAALATALASPAILMAYSAEAARRVRALVADPALHHLVAISVAVADAAGSGWCSVAVAARPDDAEMVALAAGLCQNARHE